jgi:hypothetical protein
VPRVLLCATRGCLWEAQCLLLVASTTNGSWSATLSPWPQILALDLRTIDAKVVAALRAEAARAA